MKHRSLCVAVSGVLFLQGCAAAIPAVSALSAGAAAGEKGYSFWRSGRLYYVDEGTLDQMTRAVETTLDRLALTVRDSTDSRTGERVTARRWTIRTDREHLLRLEILSLTEALVSVELDTGAFGNNAAAQLIAQRIKENLDEIQSQDALPIEATNPTPENPTISPALLAPPASCCAISHDK